MIHRPSGEMSTDIQVPSDVVKSISRVRPRGWVTSHDSARGTPGAWAAAPSPGMAMAETAVRTSTRPARPSARAAEPVRAVTAHQGAHTGVASGVAGGAHGAGGITGSTRRERYTVEWCTAFRAGRPSRSS